MRPTRRFIFRKTVVRTGMVQFVNMHQHKEACRWKSTAHTVQATRQLIMMHINKLHHTCAYGRLPLDELAGSKHEEDL